MKRLVFFLITTCFVFIALTYFVAIPKAKDKIQTTLQSIGFSKAEATNIDFSLKGASIEKINFGTGGFNYIEGLKAEIFWPTFLINPTLDTLTIDKIQIISGSNPYKNLMRLRYRLTPSKINTIDLKKLSINKIIWDVPLAKSAIRFEANAQIEQEDINKKIIFSVKTIQHELAFESQWQGFINADNHFKLDGTFERLKINFAPLRINRGVGWVSYSNTQGEDNFSGEIEAGSGSLFKVPLKNIAATIGQNKDTHPLLFRAEAAGIEDVRLSADVTISQHTNKQNMQANLNIENLRDFVSFLEEKELIQNTPIVGNDKTKVNLIFLPERKFANGPLPFQASVTRQNKAELDGTLLLYPDTYDMRGTLNSNNEFIDILRSMTSLKDSQVNDNVIRIDENLRSFLP